RSARTLPPSPPAGRPLRRHFTSTGLALPRLSAEPLGQRSRGRASTRPLRPCSADAGEDDVGRVVSGAVEAGGEPCVAIADAVEDAGDAIAVEGDEIGQRAADFANPQGGE